MHLWQTVQDILSSFSDVNSDILCPSQDYSQDKCGISLSKSDYLTISSCGKMLSAWNSEQEGKDNDIQSNSRFTKSILCLLLRLTFFGPVLKPFVNTASLKKLLLMITAYLSWSKYHRNTIWKPKISACVATCCRRTSVQQNWKESNKSLFLKTVTSYKTCLRCIRLQREKQANFPGLQEMWEFACDLDMINTGKYPDIALGKIKTRNN